jgi:hypothetical protein
MSRLRVACTSLGRRIMAGYPTKDGQRLKEPRHDVTSDVLRAVADMIEVGHEITVESDGQPQFRIAILPVKEAAQ